MYENYILGVLFDAIQIVLLAVPLYYLIKFFRRTRGYRIFAGLVVFIVTMALLSHYLHLEEIRWMLDSIMRYWPLFFIVVFQPELRRLFTEIGIHASTRNELESNEELAKEISNAVEALAKQKIGALIAIERGVKLDEYIKHGRDLNAPLVAELLATLFYPHTPMHDGGVIIRGDIILSAGCIFPLASAINKRKAFGTRHRAAIGLSEESDAVVIVVSEETGLISVAYGGELIRGIETNRLNEFLAGGIMQSSGHSVAQLSLKRMRDGVSSGASSKIIEAIAKLKESD